MRAQTPIQRGQRAGVRPAGNGHDLRMALVQGPADPRLHFLRMGRAAVAFGKERHALKGLRPGHLVPGVLACLGRQLDGRGRAELRRRLQPGHVVRAETVKKEGGFHKSGNGES